MVGVGCGALLHVGDRRGFHFCSFRDRLNHGSIRYRMGQTISSLSREALVEGITAVDGIGPRDGRHFQTACRLAL